MARTQATTTISPTRFILGGSIFAEDAVEVIEQANWTFGNRPQLHVSQSVAPAGWADAESPKLHDITFRATGAAHPVFQLPITVLPETVNVTVGAAVDNLTNGAPNDAVDVLFKVYDSSMTLQQTVTLSFSGTADNDGEKKGTFQIATTGSGDLTVSVEIEATNAGGEGASLLRLRIQDEAITSSLPAPIIE